MLPRIFYCLNAAKNVWMSVAYDMIFETSKKISFDFLKFPNFRKLKFFTFYSLCYAYFRRKRKPKIFGFKNVMERGIRNILTFVKRSIASKVLGKITLKPW